MKNILSTIIAAVPAVMLFGLSSSCTSSVEEPQIQKPAAAGEISGLTEVFEGGYIELTIPEIERAETYKWYKDGAVVRNDASRTLTVTEAGTYKVAGENEGGEGEASPDHIVTWGEILEPPADAGVIEGDTEFIEGESVTLSIAEIERAQMYKWYKDGEPMEGKTERTVTITDGGTYTVAGVNSAGEGKQSPEHTVIIHHFPADAGEISGGEAIEGLYILRVNTIEYADSYRWYCDGEFYRDDPDTTIMIMADEPGSYTVAGVNEYGEGPRSQGFEIETPPATDDPMPGPNQFTYAGNVYNINTGSVDYVDWYEAAGLADIILFDESQIQRIEIILPVGESDFETWNSDYMAWGSSWWFEYYDYWEFGTTGNYPLQSDPGGSMTDGSSSITLNRSEGRVIIVADMIYSDPSGNDIHLRINYDGPATNL